MFIEKLQKLRKTKKFVLIGCEIKQTLLRIHAYKYFHMIVYL